MNIQEFKTGRFFQGRISESDIITAVHELCREYTVKCASFSVSGSVLNATIGTYDQKQQVYVTAREDGAFDILSCSGNVIRNESRFFIHADIVLSGPAGKTTGGRLFSPTLVLAGDIALAELLGNPLKKLDDDTTGLFLW